MFFGNKSTKYSKRKIDDKVTGIMKQNNSRKQEKNRINVENTV